MEVAVNKQQEHDERFTVELTHEQADHIYLGLDARVQHIRANWVSVMHQQPAIAECVETKRVLCEALEAEENTEPEHVFEGLKVVVEDDGDLRRVTLTVDASEAEIDTNTLQQNQCLMIGQLQSARDVILEAIVELTNGGGDTVDGDGWPVEVEIDL